MLSHRRRQQAFFGCSPIRLHPPLNKKKPRILPNPEKRLRDNSAGLTAGCAHQTIRTLSKLHHGSTDNSPSSQQLEIFIDLVEREDFEGVANLALRGKRHDFGQVDVAAPERTVEGLLARNPREKRDVYAVADQPYVDIVAANRQQAECELHHLGCTSAVDDGVKVTLAGGLAQFLGDIGRGLALDVDEVIGPVFLRDGKLVGITGESDDRRTASKDLCILNGIPA